MFCTIDNDKDVDVFEAVNVDILLYQEKRAKKLRRMAE